MVEQMLTAIHIGLLKSRACDGIKKPLYLRWGSGLESTSVVLGLWTEDIDFTIRSTVPFIIPVNPPPFRGSLPRKSLISRMDWVSCAGDINLPHTPFPPARYPPNKKSSKIKSWPTFCDQYFWKFPIWNSHADEKRREIRMGKVFKWYPVIDLFDTFTGKLGHGY
jgi:hypothetical protein